jgi:hypothetical protein
MATFYFDYTDESGLITDTIGTQLDTAEDALSMAIGSLRDIAKDLRAEQDQAALVMTVKDSEGHCLYEVKNLTVWKSPC